MTEGRRMAQIMSMAMTVFMIVPIVAPGIGQLVLFIAPWRWVFGALLIYGLVVLAWALLRLPETLKPENRAPLKPGPIAANFLTVLRERQTVGYMIATTFMTACLFGYITTSEQVFVDVYDLGAAFPLAFGAVAIAISAGTLTNSRIVMRWGTTLGIVALGMVLLARPLSSVISPSVFFTLLFVLVGVRDASINVASGPLLLDVAPAAWRPLYVGFSNTVVGVAVLLTTASGLIVASVGYQVLFVISLVSFVIATWQISQYREQPHAQSSTSYA